MSRVYATCQCNGLPRTPGEVAPLGRVPRNQAEYAYSVLNREFRLRAEAVDPATNPPYLTSVVGLSIETERRARINVDVAHDAGIGYGLRPSGVAAGCL